MKKQKSRCGIYFILAVIIILICSGIVYYRMPKRYCEKIEQIEKIEVQAYCPELGYPFLKVEGLELIPNNVEVVCEDGAYGTHGLIRTNSCEPKTCLIKTVKEVCEIR